ncbi:MAG: DUF4105 domain-containing protein [Bacteriovoracaceae bacterium]|nr:DUF4105 domain-containing protein [Bacteriovoracaceae bacterium]
MILVFFLLSWAQALAQEEVFWQRWSTILHRDAQSNPHFWFSKSKDNKLELEATLEAFRSKVNWGTNDHAQCLYPARRELIEEFQMGEFEHSVCPDYDEWIERLNPSGVTIVFAGNYPDNPGSLFGHTFLKFSGTEKHGEEILDYALNYSAEISDDIGVLYAFKGLLGGYYGGFTLTPYYLKLNEYSEGEGRDLWEYKLALSAKESRFILAHVWELKNRAAFRYYFLTKNCSLFILRLIDAAHPEWQLEKKLRWYVIPLETVRALHQVSGSVTEVKYRPSVRLRAKKIYSDSTLVQKHKVRKILQNKMDPKNISDTKVLQTSLMSLASKHSRQEGRLNLEDSKLEEEILERLSELPTQPLPEAPVLASPHESHKVGQISVGYLNSQTNSLLLGHRLGVHDFADSPRGYLPFSELTILDGQLRIEEKKIALDEIDFIKITLLRPRSLDEKDWSWKASVSGEGRAQVFSQGAQRMMGQGMMGPSYYLSESWVFSLLAGVHARASATDSGFVGGKSELSLIHQTEKFQFIHTLEIDHRFGVKKDFNWQLRPQLDWVYHPDLNFDLHLKLSVPLKISGLYDNSFQSVIALEKHY